MPKYLYKCVEAGHTFEKEHPISWEGPVACEGDVDCHSLCKRIPFTGKKALTSFRINGYSEKNRYSK